MNVTCCRCTFLSRKWSTASTEKTFSLSMWVAGPQARHGWPRSPADPARPGDALHPGADAAGPSCPSRSLKEPWRGSQDTETPRVWPHFYTLGWKSHKVGSSQRGPIGNSTFFVVFRCCWQHWWVFHRTMLFLYSVDTGFLSLKIN